MIGAKPLRIRFDKLHGFTGVYDGTRYLVLFGREKYDAICNRIRYLISLKIGIKYVISHNDAKIKIDSYNVLSLENALTLKELMLIRQVHQKSVIFVIIGIF